MHTTAQLNLGPLGCPRDLLRGGRLTEPGDLGLRKVQGQVQTKLLVVQEGGLIDGELKMQGADQPEKT